MENVNKVYLTNEVAEKLGLNSNYLLRLAKDLKEKGQITEDDMRASGKRNYIFNDRAVNEISKQLEKNKKK